jgi:adenosylmethionine-8-amino-7-oxononanoate aminotransferase
VRTRCAERGLIVRSIRNSVAVCPPLVIGLDELDRLVEILRAAFDDVASA